MKNLLRVLLITLASLLFISFGSLYFIELKAGRYLSESLTKKLQVPSQIEGVSIGLKEIKARNIAIDNLPHRLLSKALTVDSLSCKNNLFEYVKKNITIEQISLEGIYLGLEFDSPKGTEGNWTELMKRLEKNTQPSSKDSSSIIIKELVLSQIQVEVAYLSSKTRKKLPIIPRIVIPNFNSSEGLTEEQIMQSVLGQMLKSVFVKENLKNMVEGVLEQPQNAIDTLIQPFKGLF